jgi:hypothetical protein
MDGVRMTRPALDLPILGQVDPAAISIRAGLISVGTILETGGGMGRSRCKEPAVLFLPAIWRVSLLVFLLVSATIEDKKYYKFKWLWR